MALITNDLDQMTVDALSQLPGRAVAAGLSARPGDHTGDPLKDEWEFECDPDDFEVRASSARWRVA